MENYWQCNLNNPPKTITVGQKLIMVCDGEKKINLTKPLQIEFLEEQHKHSLSILKTFKIEDHFLALEVAPYRTGSFNHPFKITDGKQSLLIKDLSFSVQSILKDQKAQGPFGPFPAPFPSWYKPAWLLIFVFLIMGFGIFCYRLLKRKKFIQKILQRKTYLTPSKSFVIGLRKPQKDPIQAIKNLEQLFKTFLEDRFYIPARGHQTEQIMKNLKKYQIHAYKKEGQNIRQTLNELSSINKRNADNKTFFELKKLCQNIVFLLDHKRK